MIFKTLVKDNRFVIVNAPNWSIDEVEVPTLLDYEISTDQFIQEIYDMFEVLGMQTTIQDYRELLQGCELVNVEIDVINVPGTKF